ncbi:MAG: ABC transporter ATP-binding protein [Candidatus Aenigmatarchaeota archaeon]|nr:MAG: ABC transporter ATP-binding protein [Candidatus Aenigmarchaeota archaeon]
MEKRAVIELRNVYKAFDGVPVLEGLNLTVLEGETLVIIGRSGTGKSVTLKHIVGLLTPDHGKVLVLGRDLSTLGLKELLSLRLRIGYLFQGGALLNWLTIAENVALPLREHRPELSEPEIRDIVDSKLRIVDMLHARDKLPEEVSGGMKKRAGLARAIVLDPSIILYDEPTSGLDPVMANAINELVVHTKEVTGATQVVVTHDMQSAYCIADRIAMLYEGRIIEVGSPEQIKESTNPIVRQFVRGETKGPITDGESKPALSEINVREGGSR